MNTGDQTIAPLGIAPTDPSVSLLLEYWMIVQGMRDREGIDWDFVEDAEEQVRELLLEGDKEALLAAESITAQVLMKMTHR